MVGDLMVTEIYQIESGRWAYRVESVVQEWNPEQPGFVPMTETEAESWAAIIAERIYQS